MAWFIAFIPFSVQEITKVLHIVLCFNYRLTGNVIELFKFTIFPWYNWHCDSLHISITLNNHKQL